MPTPTVPQFLELLRRSSLIEPGKLDEVLAEIDAGSTEAQLDDVKYVSSQFVKRYFLTVWHVRQLLKGRYRGFFLRQYKILGHLGSGGMSTVYLAEHTLMKRRVAIKVLPRKRLEKSVYLERFVREAQAIASLDHPNIVRAYDIDNEGDIHYIVMEYFQGENLQKIVEKEGKVPFPRIVNILRQIADALAHAHEIGIIHRDVKPSNILVNTQGEAKILDLGLALLDEKMFEGRITHIQEDTILGTADYLAPEQALDSHKVDARADIYALGGVLYFCLTGHPPFPEGSVSKRLLAHQQKQPQNILIDRPDAPVDLINLCKKMMSKKPEDRQQDAMEVAGDLEDWLIEHGYAEPSEFTLATLSPSVHTKQGQIKTLSDSAAVRIANQGKLIRILHQMDAQDAQKSNAEPAGSESDFSILGEEVQINLLDSAHGSSFFSQDGSSAPARSSAESGIKNLSFDDPILHALNDIERQRLEERRREGTKSSNLRTRYFETEKTKSLEENRQTTKNVDSRVSSIQTKQEQTEDESAWYRQVPIWFWTLFLSGYAAAIFFAGILVTLLFIIMRSSGE